MTHVVVSCEHATAHVPARYRPAMRAAGRALATHRGFDSGALTLARALARRARAPLIVARVTRLLVDLNRSRSSPSLFSAWSAALPAAEREHLVERYWEPHRAAVVRAVDAARRGGRTAVHLSVHSFTPRWKGVRRTVDVGFLFDPALERERALVDAWMDALGALRPELRSCRNRPYRGTSDGLTTALRARYRRARYVGIELEVSQRFTLGPPAAWRALRRDLVASCAQALRGSRAPS